jgi:hypothetical protein
MSSDCRRIASADFFRSRVTPFVPRHSGLDPESSSAPLDSGFRRNDELEVGSSFASVPEAA